MLDKKFLVPVGVAIAALISSQSHAALTPTETKVPLELGNLTEDIKKSRDTVLQNLIYQLGEEQHALLLLKPASGMIYAQHGSHASHASHGSHRSHRSGY
jgi:hypothetical protein